MTARCRPERRRGAAPIASFTTRRRRPVVVPSGVAGPPRSRRSRRGDDGSLSSRAASRDRPDRAVHDAATTARCRPERRRGAPRPRRSRRSDDGPLSSRAASRDRPDRAVHDAATTARCRPERRRGGAPIAPFTTQRRRLVVVPSGVEGPPRSRRSRRSDDGSLSSRAASRGAPTAPFTTRRRRPVVVPSGVEGPPRSAPFTTRRRRPVVVPSGVEGPPRSRRSRRGDDGPLSSRAESRDRPDRAVRTTQRGLRYFSMEAAVSFSSGSYSGAVSICSRSLSPLYL